MVNSLKKAFSTFVTLTTVLWSVGAGALAFPNVASAATLSAGDLVKASGPAVYYYAANGKRYVFPNEKTYLSWYSDFSSVKTITDAELAAISIGGNVTTRPGTHLVKITTDPKTYAVTQGGVLHWIQSEAIAKALYGDNWATQVIDVPDAFFVNYTVGSSIATNVHPDGQLIQYAGDSNWYVVWSGMKRKVASDAALAANGLNKKYVEMTTIVYGNGADLAGREAALADTVSVSAATTPPVVGGPLTVALASDTPTGMNVPRNASSVPLVKVNLTAGSADVNVTGLRFHRVGIGAVADFSNVYLYDQAGKRLTTGRSINTTTNIVEFNSLSITVKAGTTWAVLVYGDFAGSSATVGGQHGLELADMAAVTLSGSSTVGGTFPVRGNMFTVGAASSARVDIQKGTQPANPNIGSADTEVSNFKVTANTNDVALKQITLYQAGSVTNSDLTKFKLYQGSTVVASADSIASDGHLVLMFTTPFVVTNGTTKVFSLRANVGGRAGRTIRLYVEYTTDVTAIDQVYKAGAAICINSSSPCTGSSANMDGTGGSGSSPQTNGNFVEVLTQGGQLTNAYNGPATANIAKGQLSVPLYKFALTSPDNTLEIRKIVFTIAKTSGSAATCAVKGGAGTNYFRSVKIKNLDTGATVMGPQEIPSATANGATSQAFTYTDSFNLNQGQTLNLGLVADLSNSADTGDTYLDGACAYQASFSAFGSSDVRVVATGEFLDTAKIVPNTAVTGNALTVKSSGLTISLASTPVTGTLVKKQANVSIAGFVLTAAAQSDITVTSLSLGGQASLATAGCNSNAFGGAACNLADFSQRVTSLALYRADTNVQVGLARAPDTTTGKAQITNMNLLIPKGTSLSLLAKATFGSTASTTSPFDRVAVGIALAADLQVQDQDSNTVTPTLDSAVTGQATGASPSVIQKIRNNGTITVQADSHPVSNIVVAGKDAWVQLAQYKATAQYEQLSIDRIAVVASSTAGTVVTLGGSAAAADDADFSAIAVAQGGAVKGQDVLPSGATGTKDIDLTVNPITVPKDGSVQFQIWGKLANVQASSTVGGATAGVARSGHAPAVGLRKGISGGEWDSNYISSTNCPTAGNQCLNIRSTGVASGERVYADQGASHGNLMALRKTQPIVTKQSLSSTTLANIDMDLLKFQVAADSAGSIAWKQAVIDFSKTSGVTLTNFRLRRGATDLNTSVYAITSATSGADLTTGSGLTTTSTSGSIVVSFAPGQEEAISGSGNVYTIHATVSGAVAGQNVSLTFRRETNTTSVVGGYLTNNPISTFATSTNVFHIDTGVTAAAQGSGLAGFMGTFLWSDNSEVPHSSALGTAGGSRDWINDTFVQDLSQSQTVSL